MTYSCIGGLIGVLSGHDLIISRSTVFKTSDSLKNSAINIERRTKIIHILTITEFIMRHELFFIRLSIIRVSSSGSI